MKKIELKLGELVTACGNGAAASRKFGILIKVVDEEDGDTWYDANVYWVGKYPRFERVCLSYLRKIT
jgi:hypothetical protein